MAVNTYVIYVLVLTLGHVDVVRLVSAIPRCCCVQAATSCHGKAWVQLAVPVVNIFAVAECHWYVPKPDDMIWWYDMMLFHLDHFCSSKRSLKVHSCSGEEWLRPSWSQQTTRQTIKAGILADKQIFIYNHFNCPTAAGDIKPVVSSCARLRTCEQCSSFKWCPWSPGFDKEANLLS